MAATKFDRNCYLKMNSGSKCEDCASLLGTFVSLLISSVNIQMLFGTRSENSTYVLLLG